MINEIERLLQPFYGVMHKYRKHFTEKGVRSNLSSWYENKASLLTLLRKHPDWNEDAFAVVLPITERRDIDPYLVFECRQSLIHIAQLADLDNEHYRDFVAALTAATESCSVSPTEAQIETIKTRGGVVCSVGQKSSRIISKLCNAFGVNKHEEYEKTFAKLADALSPIEQPRKAMLSVHPCDFLEMSNKDNSWHSCHSLDGGSYQTGCLSYMIDGVTMIFYTVDESISSNYHQAHKRTRQVFCYSGGLLLQSRLYPNDNNKDACNRYRYIVQHVLADCVGAENRWVILKDVKNLLHTVPGSKQYQDYSTYHTVCTLKSAGNRGELMIGAPPTCVCCGGVISNSGNLKCDCEAHVVCDACGETVYHSSARYFDGAWVCKTCLHTCDSCGQVTRSKHIPAWNGQGNVIHICRECDEQRQEICASCGVQSICLSLGCSRFCRAIAANNAAA